MQSWNASNKKVISAIRINTILNYYSTGLFRMSRDTEMKQANLKYFFFKESI